MMHCSPDMVVNLWTSSIPPTVSDMQWTTLWTLLLLQMRVYCHTGYTPFHSFPPPLSASCNRIPLCARAPPPRQLTFPLIHSKVPRGVNNCTPVCSHYPTSTGLIQLIKVSAVNQLTDLGPLSILLLILFIGMLTVVDCVVGNVSRSGRGRGAHCAVSATFRQIQSVCCSSAHQQYLIVCSFSVGFLAWQHCCGLDFINCLLQSLDKCSLV